MYNKPDEQVMTSYNNDLLELSPEQLNFQRGFVGVYNLRIKIGSISGLIDCSCEFHSHD